VVISGDKVRWLFWLRWKMFLRGFTRASGRVSYIIGTIFQLLFGLLIGGGVGIGSYFAYRYLPTPANSAVLFLILTGVYVLWLILPLFEYSVNEGLDLSKLALFPLTKLELMTSLLFSTLLDVPTIGLFLVLGGAVVGWALSVPLALFTLLTMLIFYAQVVGSSQLVLALLARTLQSRRFRDLSVVLIILFSSSCYIVSQVVARGLGSANFLSALKNATFAQYLQWLPPGMAARAVQQASVGNWGLSFVWLFALLIVTAVVLYLWQLVVERGLTATEGGGAIKVRRRRVQSVVEGAAMQDASADLLERIIPAQVRAIALKDLKYYRRDPQLLGLIAQSLITIVFLFFITLANGGGLHRITASGPWAVMIAPLYIFLSLYTLSYNVLGFERQSLTTLFLFPIEPKRILWGKNLVVLILGIIEMALVVLAAAFITHAWVFVLPAFAVGLAGIGVILGIGNITSVFFPMRMRQMGRGFQGGGANASTQNGCLRSVMSLVTLALMLIVLVPVVLALVLPVIFSAQWVWIITIPLSVVYGAVIYFGVTALVAPRLVDRIPEIIAATTRE
jgi:ABC-2 type transport system permease protein